MGSNAGKILPLPLCFYSFAARGVRTGVWSGKGGDVEWRFWFFSPLLPWIVGKREGKREEKGSG